jgi:SAM-dependent methyltransferase
MPLRSTLVRAAGLLPPPRDEAALRTLRAGRDLLLGRAAPQPPRRRVRRAPAAKPTEPATPSRSTAATLPPLERPPALEGMQTWLVPPVSPGHDVLTRVRYATGAAPARYDVALVDQLNDEYRDKPIVPAPPSYAPQDRMAVAKQRIAWVQQRVDLRSKTTLEIGCSNGYETWLLGHNVGCDAYGVDVNARGAWDDLAGERVHFECADMAVDNPFDANTFDVVLSFAVWEHVAHPRRLLQATYDVLKPGGFAWIRASLFCGPQASHRYREIFFPWPHLLFSEDVPKDWDVAHGRPPKGPAWVNRLTWDNYEQYIHEIGFLLRRVNFQEADWDEEFYLRFEDMLGRYSRRDLRRDFFLAVLQKPG